MFRLFEHCAGTISKQFSLMMIQVFYLFGWKATDVSNGYSVFIFHTLTVRWRWNNGNPQSLKGTPLYPRIVHRQENSSKNWAPQNGRQHLSLSSNDVVRSTPNSAWYLCIYVGRSSRTGTLNFKGIESDASVAVLHAVVSDKCVLLLIGGAHVAGQSRDR
jgi:hypothetical protein